MALRVVTEPANIRPTSPQVEKLRQGKKTRLSSQPWSYGPVWRLRTFFFRPLIRRCCVVASSERFAIVARNPESSDCTALAVTAMFEVCARTVEI